VSDSGLSREWFARIDPSPDALFYAAPRLVNHIDDATIAALTDYYREVLPPGGAILDLMSSWVSHLPADVSFRRVAGLGMNGDELAANPRLSDFCVHDLNARPELPYPAESFDAVLNAVSIQYLIDPVAVFAEVRRVLRPGGISIVAMSHRCFPTKAVRAFHVLPPDGRFELVATYHALAGGFDAAACLDRSPQVARSSQGREAAAQRGEAERSVGSREGWKASEDHRASVDPLWIVAARRLG
jgi:SAM-dependent methyltransferase